MNQFERGVAGRSCGQNQVLDGSSVERFGHGLLDFAQKLFDPGLVWQAIDSELAFLTDLAHRIENVLDQSDIEWAGGKKAGWIVGSFRQQAAALQRLNNPFHGFVWRVQPSRQSFD